MTDAIVTGHRESYRGYDCTSWRGGWRVDKDGRIIARARNELTMAQNSNIARAAVDHLEKRHSDPT